MRIKRIELLRIAPMGFESIASASSAILAFIFFVRKKRLELLRPFEHQFLRLAWLPLHHLRFLCERGDSNSYALRHTPLKRTWLPITTRSHIYFLPLSGNIVFIYSSVPTVSPLTFSPPFSTAICHPISIAAIEIINTG